MSQEESPNEVRKRVKRLKKVIDESYIQLGKDFYLIYHRRLFSQWGHDSFADYIENEVGMAQQRADRCRRIWTKFVKECGVSPAEMETVSYTSALMLQQVVDETNVREWLDRAKGVVRDSDGVPVATKPMSYRELESEIAEARATHPRSGSKSVSADEADEDDEETKIDGATSAPVDRRKHISVYCHPSQYKVIDAAMAEAKRAKKIEMADSEALAHVATEFLGARMSKEEQPLVRVQFLLGELETVYGGKFVWIQNNDAAAFLKTCMEQRPELFNEPSEKEDNDD